MTRDTMRRLIAPELQRALDRARYWEAVWRNFWWITIGGASLALCVACLVSPGP